MSQGPGKGCLSQVLYSHSPFLFLTPTHTHTHTHTHTLLLPVPLSPPTPSYMPLSIPPSLSLFPPLLSLTDVLLYPLVPPSSLLPLSKEIWVGSFTMAAQTQGQPASCRKAGRQPRQLFTNNPAWQWTQHPGVRMYAHCICPW